LAGRVCVWDVWSKISCTISAYSFRIYGKFSIAYTDDARDADHMAKDAACHGGNPVGMVAAWAEASAPWAEALAPWVAWAVAVESAASVAIEAFVVFPCFHFLHL
jgi:hypothetical protein